MGWYILFAYFFIPGKESLKVEFQPSLKRLLVVPRLAASALIGGLLELQHLGLYLRPTESNSLGWVKTCIVISWQSLTHAKV